MHSYALIVRSSYCRRSLLSFRVLFSRYCLSLAFVWLAPRVHKSCHSVLVFLSQLFPSSYFFSLSLSSIFCIGLVVLLKECICTAAKSSYISHLLTCISHTLLRAMHWYLLCVVDTFHLVFDATDSHRIRVFALICLRKHTTYQCFATEPGNANEHKFVASRYTQRIYLLTFRCHTI